jgi:hypothetical protein
MGERRTLKHQTAFARLLDHCGAADADWRQRAIQDHPLLGRMANALTPRPSTVTPQHVGA